MNGKTPESVRLRFSSRVVWLEVVQSVADDLSDRVGFGEDDRFAVSMAIREGTNNAIIHGNQRDQSKTVEVEFLTYPDRIEIRVRDEGPGFEQADLPDPLAPENLLSSHGRGVFLIRHYMDTVDLAAASQAGGEIRMTKRLPTEPAATPTRG